MVFIFYMLFMKYKLRNRESKLLGVLFYCLMYLGFIAIAIAISTGEKIGNSGPKQIAFFNIFAQILGYTSAICNVVALLPQIYTLIKSKKSDNLSPIMYALQIPGNIITIVFQAVLFGQPVSTWITYVISCIEQTVVFVLILVFHYRNRNDTQQFVEEWENSPEDTEEILPLV